VPDATWKTALKPPRTRRGKEKSGTERELRRDRAGGGGIEGEGGGGREGRKVGSPGTMSRRSIVMKGSVPKRRGELRKVMTYPRRGNKHCTRSLWAGKQKLTTIKEMEPPLGEEKGVH